MMIEVTKVDGELLGVRIELIKSVAPFTTVDGSKSWSELEISGYRYPVVIQESYIKLVKLLDSPMRIH